MSEIRNYLEAKTALGAREWLRREPRETHPEILEHVRAFQAAGGFYDDDAERYVEEQVGDLPAHRYHGHPERDPLTDQLGHEVYIAKSILRDEAARLKLEAFEADGFAPFDANTVQDGARYSLILGTLYTGRDIPDYGDPVQVRARREGTILGFLPKGARTRGYIIDRPALIRRES